MDLRDLRYFAAIANGGSLSAAAKALRVAQPTLTVAMQQLEEHLGTQLLIRERNGVRLTVTGEELLRHANEVFRLMEEAERRIKGLESEDGGRFVLGCHESLGAYFLPDFMAKFLRECPRIELLISNETSAAVRDSVIERRTDFGIVVNPSPHPDLVMVELFHDAMDVLVAEDAAPPSRPLAAYLEAIEAESGEVPTVSAFHNDPAFEIARHRLLAGPLIYAGRVKQCQDLCESLGNAGLLTTRKLVVGDLELVKSLALAGIGPALLPRRVGNYGHEGKLVRLNPQLPFIPDTIFLLYRADMHRTSAALRVKDALIAYGKRLDTKGA